jgi:hypothetical protein
MEDLSLQLQGTGNLPLIVVVSAAVALLLAGAGAVHLIRRRWHAAGLCLANRLRGVRAVTGVEASAVAAATAAVGANLLVVDPLAGSFFPLKQMVTEFCRGGGCPCPDAFRARLA